MESFKNVLMSPGGGMKRMPCHVEAKVSLLVVLGFVFFKNYAHKSTFEY